MLALFVRQLAQPEMASGIDAQGVLDTRFD